jgi:hypothetical protein
MAECSHVRGRTRGPVVFQFPRKLQELKIHSEKHFKELHKVEVLAKIHFSKTG